jgi:hypothetical protein
MSTNEERDATRPDEPEDAAHTDYLWDRSGAPDPEIVALEGALASRRWSGRLPEALEPAPVAPLSRGDRILRLLPRALAASLIAAGLIAAGLAAWHGLMEPHDSPADSDSLIAEAPQPAVDRPAVAASPYSIESSDGRFQVEAARAADGALVAGSRLVTQPESRVTLRVGPIGRVTVEPETRLRIEDATAGAGATSGGEYLLWLERGSISASIFAAPRLFQLGTPSGIAVDMGCMYTASVDEAGVTRLAVTLGQVSFETPQRHVLVPAGASTRAWPGRGPGTPVWDDATPEFRAAVERLDELSGRVESGATGAPGATDGAIAGPARMQAEVALATVLETQRPEDSLSLWHLLDDELGDELRGRTYDKLEALAPPPAGVTREGCLARDREQLLAWRDTLGWAWPASGGTKGKLLQDEAR